MYPKTMTTSAELSKTGSGEFLLSRYRTIRFIVLFFVVSTAIALMACGSESTPKAFSQVTPDDTILSLDDFTQTGLKKVKEYDVEGLPSATGAYLIYFTPPDSDPIQYEMRVYPDHASAVESGAEYAAEVTGTDALLREVDVRWKDGTRDRRSFGASRVTITALYADYAVYGNVILLCEGRDSAQSLERCAALLRAAGFDVGD